VIQENETILALAGDEFFGYHQQVMPALFKHIRGKTFVT
jgi:hypothetical protein